MGHRARQHSQGFFEPSLPHATGNNVNGSGLSASQIAAQAAMHTASPPVSSAREERTRPRPGGLAPINTGGISLRPPSRDGTTPTLTSPGGLPYSNGTVGGSRLAATSAANAAYPTGRSPLPSPGLLPPAMPPPPLPAQGPPPDKEPRAKSSKMKLFSKPKALGLSKEKEAKVATSVPSPGRGGMMHGLGVSGWANASMSNLATPGSGANSLYSSMNTSTSTLVPSTSEKEKEKRHHFLSRQKNKLKDDMPQLPLSSAHSNSQPTNPERPQPLYSFTPESPAPSTFSKSVSGFDLRHGGRALREKKKEEKAAARLELSNITPLQASTGGTVDHFGPATQDTIVGTPTGTPGNFFGKELAPSVSVQQFAHIGQSMGLTGISLDDAWPLLKARLLNIFSGEELRTPIEDFNTLVVVHIRRCVQRKSPIILLEDLRDLLRTGFGSLGQTLRGVADDKLVMKLVEMWIGVYGSILPFLQAVFLPMDLEFKGRGQIMSVREAQEFWGAVPESLQSDERPASAGGTTRLPTLGEELDVRRITLIAFRDIVLLPRHDALMAIFSRLSLNSINATSSHLTTTIHTTGRPHARSDLAADRPSTADSLGPHMSSFNSQGSTLLDVGSNSTSSTGFASRSRATSSTSAGSFGTGMPHLGPPPLPLAPGAFHAMTTPPTVAAAPLSPHLVACDPARVTDTVARMLQCLYVLASCQTGDAGQGVVERLTGALKHNWLGRGRTGRNRRGWVGTKLPPGQKIGLVMRG